MESIRDRILLVDDDDAARLMVKRGLEQRGLDVREATSGHVALDTLALHAPDIVVLDAMMPDLDGFETCRRIRVLPRYGSVPVLILTSLDDDISVSRAYEAGATDFLVKSARHGLIAERIRYLLRSSRAQEELRFSRGQLAKAQRIARLGSWEWSPGDQRVVCSEECMRILNRPAEAGHMPEDWFAGALAACSATVLRAEIAAATQSGGSFSRDYTLAGSDGSLRHVHVEAEPDESDTGTDYLILGTIQDVTERRTAEERVRQLANFDGLTGLPDRLQFRERLGRAIESAEVSGHRIAVLYIGLDRFKVVNDTLGHSAGDQLLRDVAARLSRCVRGGELHRRSAPESSNVARLGDDEFAVLLTDLKNREDATSVAARIVSELRQPFTVAGNEFWISASVGISICPDDGTDGETLLMRADAAMYHQKSQGRNGHASYTASLDSRGRELFRLEADLRKAIDREELRLYYQPVVNVTTGRIVGAEALMRWQRGDKLVSPADFIPLAEDTGLIIPMGEWALHEACRKVRRWLDADFGSPYVSVNISGSHFKQRELLPTVERALLGTRTPPGLLQLEITETVAMHGVEATQRTLARAREMGVRVAIDDFGTGYSSLAYLKRLPIDTLKIDRSFVNDIARDADDEAIVSAIIGLARSLGLSIVAEGVENDNQVGFLSMFGATLMQGYLFARPVPEEEFVRLMEQNLASHGNPAWKCPERSRVMQLFDGGRRRVVQPAETALGLSKGASPL